MVGTAEPSDEAADGVGVRPELIDRGDDRFREVLAEKNEDEEAGEDRAGSGRARPSVR